MEGQYLIYGLAGIILLFLMIRLLKWPIKILINGIIGVVILYLANFYYCKSRVNRHKC